MTLPAISSKYPTVQPPNLKFPEVSSSGPPGACITPSSVMKDRTISFRMFATSLLDFCLLLRRWSGQELIASRRPCLQRPAHGSAQRDSRRAVGLPRAGVGALLVGPDVDVVRA